MESPDGSTIKEIEHSWIPMPDGTRLAARIWLPEAAWNMPVPAILEYIPYRKRDMVRARDERNHPYIASHGYACLRVDMRGSGDSEGHMPDMYDDNELADARHVIEWIAAQSWCNGKVGMFGTSWGGTASLQAAVDAPGPLKAVLANCATIDRYEDDIHWKGGCLLTDTLEWGAALPAILAAPPDSATVGEDWWAMWQQRLEKLAHPLEAWLRNKRRGRYWRHGSVRFAADKLSCPILTIGGWADRYSNSVIPLVKARPDICWGIVGPWGHHYPDQGEPGPAIGFQDLALEWWDFWLKPSGQVQPAWPKLRLWRRAFDPPQDRLPQRNGEWIELPSIGEGDEGDRVVYFVGRAGLTPHPGGPSLAFDVPFDLRHGKSAGDTGYFGRRGGLPLEQSADDAYAGCFETGPLEEVLDLIGHASFTAEIARDLQQAQLVCRISDVAPDGRANLVTRVIVNLELDELLDEVAPFQAGRAATRCISFPSTAYRFAKGHRIRLSLSASYWPLIWPTGQSAGIRLMTGNARLALPSAPKGMQDLAVPFPTARQLPRTSSWKRHSQGDLQRRPQEIRDGVLYSSWYQPPVTHRFEKQEIEICTETRAEYQLPLDAPNSAKCETLHRIRIHRRDGNAEIESRVIAKGSKGDLEIVGQLRALWDGSERLQKQWTYRVK